MAMCVQEERMKGVNGGTINYLKDNKKKNTNANFYSKSKGKGPMLHQPQQKQVHSRERSMSLLQEDGTL